MADPSAKRKRRPTPITFGDASISDLTLFIEEQDFKAMLLGDFKMARENRVEIKDVSVDIFNKILEIMYYGRMSEYNALNSDNILFNHIQGCDAYFHEYGTDIIKMVDYNKNALNFLNELCTVADRFNVTKLILHCLAEMFCEIVCGKSGCYFCLNLYMFAFQKKMFVGGFPSFSKENYKTWLNAMHKEDTPDGQLLFHLNQHDISILLDKFS